MRKRKVTGIVTTKTIKEGKKNEGGRSQGERRGAKEEQINKAAVGRGNI